ALIAALVGGSVGALVMHSRNQSTTAAQTATQDPNAYTPASQEQVAVSQDQFIPAEFDTAGEQSAYKVGFADGFRAAEAGSSRELAPQGSVYQPRRTARRYAHSSSRPVYYSSQRPRSRSFWQKHRDKLTVAIGAGSGAAIGALVGGKKGAAIGALAGGGGSALWTYKLRNRDRRY
ncbi:MAG: YMGG-like glycine zipper-containing protein, partial [Pyrinomonadaceae bacterium]